MKRRKSNTITVLLIALMLVWTGNALVQYSRSSSETVTERTELSLESTAHNNVNIVNFAFDSYLAQLESYAAYLNLVYTDDEMLAEKIREEMISESYEKVSLIFPSGRAIVVSRDEILEYSYGYTEPMKQGKSFVSDVLPDYQSVQPHLSINVPVYSSSGEIVSYISAVLSFDNLSALFSESFYNNDGFYYLVDSNGEFFASNDPANTSESELNFLDHIESFTFEDGYSGEQLINAIGEHTSGHTVFLNAQGNLRYGYYATVGINDWLFFSVSTAESINDESDSHVENGQILIIKLMFAFTVLLIVVINDRRVMVTKAEEYEQNTTLLSNQIGKVIFEWNLRTNKFSSSSDFGGMFGYPLEENTSVDSIISSQMIHPDDVVVMDDALAQVAYGVSATNIKFRLRHAKKNYVWCSLNVIPIANKRGKYFKAMGILENIDASVRETQELRTKSERDPLTDLYNKGATEMLIKDILSESTIEKNQHYLMIIDIDNFKAVNDRLGHQFGDDVLKELSAKLHDMFRSGDIIGRVGGDEFFVFLKDFSSTYSISEKATAICEAFKTAYSDGTQTIPISASIGIAAYPNFGHSFEILYRNADIALYDTKARGKNGFTVFNGHTKADYVSNRTEIDSNEDCAEVLK